MANLTQLASLLGMSGTTLTSSASTSNYTINNAWYDIATDDYMDAFTQAVKPTKQTIAEHMTARQQRAMEQQQAAMNQYAQQVGIGSALTGAFNKAAPTPAPAKSDEFTWLRGRVNEMCWKAA